MLRFLELARDAVAATVAQLVAWLQSLAEAGAFDPRQWQPLTWLIVALVALALLALLLRRRRGAPRGLPEMLITHGEIALVEGPDSVSAQANYGVAAPARAQHRLELTLSNLNPYPVQLLELAVRTRGLRMPVVAEAGAVVPPNGAVDVDAELFDLPGDAGVVELYIYSNRGRRRTYRLSAPLEWEPWGKRYRVKALALKVTPVTALASQERRKRERRSFESAKRRERQRELAEATWRRAEEFTKQVQERRVAAADRRRAVAEQRPERVTVPLRGTRNGAGDYPEAETVYSGAAAPSSETAWSADSTVAAPADPFGRAPGTERRRAAADAAREAPRAGDASGRNASGRNDLAQDDSAHDAPRTQDAPAPRRRLEFPDEF